MKVCFLYEFLSEVGGIEREIVNHAHFLQEAGHEVEVLTCFIDPKLVDSPIFKGLKVRDISRLRINNEALKILTSLMGFNKLKEIKADTIVSYSFLVNYLISNMKCKKVNYVNHYPHFIYLPFKEKVEWANNTVGLKRWVSVLGGLIVGPYLRRLDKKLVKRLDVCFMNSEFTKKRLEKIYARRDFIVSYPPIDKRFHPAHKKMEKYIFLSGRIIPDKKCEWLIEACSYMKQKLPLFIAGQVNDAYKQRLEKLAKDLKVNVKFLGAVTSFKKLNELYSSAEIFAFPTPKEDFGLCPVESITCGVPAVVWGDGGGPTESIKDGVNGYYAKPYDLRDFAAKMDKLIGFKAKNKKKVIESAKKFSAAEQKKIFLKGIGL